MFSIPTARWLQRRGIHYGWLVAAITFLTMLTMSAALGLPGAMLQPLSREFGWSTEQISGSLALRFALFGLLGPFAAVFMERFGLRAVMVTGLLLVGAAMALVTQATQLWQLFMLWSLLLGIGTGLTALVLGAVVANRWFVARKGLVVGVLTASAATGQLAFLPMAAWMIEHWGWRSATIPVCAGSALVALLVVALVRDRPSDLGLAPYGGEPTSIPAGAAPHSAMTLATPFRVLAEAAGHRTFWLLAGTFFICGLSTNGLVQTHFISLCGDRGMSAVPAASVLAMMGAFDFVGTVLSGWLSDRYDNRKLLFWYYGLRGLSLFWLPHSEFTFYGLGLFAMFYGLDWIATVPPTVKLTAQHFGPEKVGLVFGWIFAAHQLGAATAAWGAGLTRTLLLTYTPALYGAGAACLAAAVMAMVIGRTRAMAGTGRQGA
ncbi:MFS transporter [Acidovorax sp. NCPPB 3859]|nr:MULTISPECIES: MFS transporter [unclassified Acidovorax]MDA8451760.1 MFS transporter [Acidovorax sp. GBBC 3297]MDA8461213.1 MFS transporter [Acidovorax sp. GBBC 3333]MDA8466246.1 MFS transporter [Acidovorax sp. GBBC 3332]MDA8471274.1 MFS transporter [Acidovorax sp. GBBC 3299]WCM76632.1 MFS transporter [Acidovorax sp. GBBC 712]